MQVDAIKTIRDISLINQHFNKNYSKMSYLFKIGINTALRISDLLALKFDDIEHNTIDLIEIKSKKRRLITLNNVTLSAINQLRAIDPTSIYLFQSKHSELRGRIKPYHRNYIQKAFSEASEINGLSTPYHLGTHSMRKTFGYHQYTNNMLKLGKLMMIFGHSSESTTLKYIGITADDIAKTYQQLEL